MDETTILKKCGDARFDSLKVHSFWFEGGFMIRIAYIAYSFTSARIFMNNVLSELQDLNTCYNVDFRTLDIKTDKWHLTIIPLNCANIVAKTFCRIDYACKNWRNEISLDASGKEYKHCVEIEEYIRTRFYEDTEWVDIRKLKDLLYGFSE